LLLCGVWEITARRMRGEVLNPGLEAKACTLLRHYPNPRIVIAGDSRCLYHLRPDIITEKTGLSSVNIALEFCDIVTTVNCIQKCRELTSADFILISASVYQINDNIIDFGYFSAASFFQTTVPEQASLFWNHSKELLDRYRTSKALYSRTVFKNGLFTCADKDHLPLPAIAARGFRGMDRVWDGVFGDANFNWYCHYRDHGVKQHMFEKALNKLEKTGPMILVIFPPLCPAWKQDSRAAFTVDIERRYIEFCRQCLRSKTSRVVSEFEAPENEFPDSLFMDPLHLNLAGAEKFSRMIGDSLARMAVELRK
jgi:hypothetical protein